MTSQMKIKHWHEVIGDPTIADAIMDRLVSSSHRIEINGKSLRKRKTE
jgi:DNA replication protein DnaC